MSEVVSGTASDTILFPVCKWCGTYHAGAYCDRVKAIEYYRDGSVKRVEFWDREYTFTSGYAWWVPCADQGTTSEQGDAF